MTDTLQVAFFIFFLYDLIFWKMLFFNLINLVSSPFEYTISLRKNSNKDLKLLNCRMPTYLILVFIWFLSMFLWVPVILFLKTRTTIKLDYLKTVNSTKEEYSLSDCDVETLPWIIIPHSIIVYHLPIAMIFLFYSKTINILNKKTLVKKRSTLTRKSPSPQTQPQPQQSGNNIQQKRFSNVLSTISSLSKRKETKVEVFELHSLKSNRNSINRKEKVSRISDSDSFLKTKTNDTVKTKEISLTSASSNSTYTTKKVSLKIHSYSLNESKQKYWHKSDSILENHAQKVKFEKLNSESHLELSLPTEKNTAQKRRLSNLDYIELIKNDPKQTSVETRDNVEEKSSLFGCLFIQKEKMRQEKRITYRYFIYFVYMFYFLEIKSDFFYFKIGFYHVHFYFELGAFLRILASKFSLS